MNPLGEREHAESSDDIITRRLKNRERQRRYRARKRLEADMKKASVINQPPPMQVEIQVNGVHNACGTRIYCQRDWKKDARNAHAFNNKQEVKPDGPLIPDSTPVTGSQASLESIGHSRSSIVESTETHRSTPSRRHWKTEARNKKN